MIRYDLACSHGHGFDAWFSDSAAFEEQQAAGLVTCPVCGDTNVRRQLACPGIPVKSNRRAEAKTQAPRQAPDAAGEGPPTPALSEGEAQMLRQFVRELHAMVREKAEYVGPRFAEEARRRHAEGKTQGRPIWGEASVEEAKALREEGIDVMPLPPLPDKKN